MTILRIPNELDLSKMSKEQLEVQIAELEKFQLYIADAKRNCYNLLIEKS